MIIDVPLVETWNAVTAAIHRIHQIDESHQKGYGQQHVEDRVASNFGLGTMAMVGCWAKLVDCTLAFHLLIGDFVWIVDGLLLRVGSLTVLREMNIRFLYL